MQSKAMVLTVLIVATLAATATPVAADGQGEPEIGDCIIIFLNPPGVLVDPACLPPPISDILPDD